MSDEEDTSTSTTPATDPGDAARAKVKMDDEKWAKVQYLAEVEGKRGSELARMFGVSPTLISRFFRDKNIQVGSKKPKEIVAAAVDDAQARLSKMITEFGVQRRTRIQQTKIQHYTWSAQIAAEAMAIVASAKADAKPLGNYDKDLKALHKAGAIIEKMRIERFITLDAEGEIDEASLPKIEFHDLTDEDIIAIQSSRLDDGDSEDGERSEVVET